MKVYSRSPGSFKLCPEMMPEIDRTSYKYQYVFISHKSIQSKAWIVQLQQYPDKTDIKETLCRWGNCFQAVDLHFKAQIRVKKKDKKKVVGMDSLCLYHKLMNMSLKQSVDPCPNELWNAALGGVNWQQTISEESLFGHLLQGKIRSRIKQYFESVGVRDKKALNDVPGKEYQDKLRKDIVDLHRNASIESEFSKELKDFIADCTDSSMVLKIKRIINLKTFDKLEKLRGVKSCVKPRGLNRPSSCLLYTSDAADE